MVWLSSAMSESMARQIAMLIEKARKLGLARDSRQALTGPELVLNLAASM